MTVVASLDFAIISCSFCRFRGVITGACEVGGGCIGIVGAILVVGIGCCITGSGFIADCCTMPGGVSILGGVFAMGSSATLMIPTCTSFENKSSTVFLSMRDGVGGVLAGREGGGVIVSGSK